MTTVATFPAKKEYARKHWDVTRVIIADDHPRVRAAIRNLLVKASDILILGEAGDGEEALRLVEELNPDVLLLDIEMPRMNGVEVARALKTRGGQVKILVLSAYHDRQYVRSMLANGVAGYLVKEDVPDKIMKAVRGVARGEEGWISRKIAAKIGVWENERTSKSSNS